MKNWFLLLPGFCLLLYSCGPSRSTVSVQYDSYGNNNVAVGYETFYHELSPYGRWIDYPEYGYVWVPSAEAGFRPYATNGHWVYTDYGWTWASDYRWGWAAFHYGRWMYEDGYGWMWLPGNEWAPAWVMWGRSGGYYGWAPLAPRISINAGWNPPVHYWNFCPAEHMTRINVNNYVVNTTNNTTVVNNITKNVTVINNTTVNNNNNSLHVRNAIFQTGPQVQEIEKATNSQVQQVKISGSDKPGESLSDKKLTVYKPLVNTNNTNNVKATPPRVEKYQVLNQGNQNLNNDGREKQDVMKLQNSQQKMNTPGQGQQNMPLIKKEKTEPPKQAEQNQVTSQPVKKEIRQLPDQQVQKEPVYKTPVRQLNPSGNNSNIQKMQVQAPPQGSDHRILQHQQENNRPFQPGDRTRNNRNNQQSRNSDQKQGDKGNDKAKKQQQ